LLLDAFKPDIAEFLEQDPEVPATVFRALGVQAARRGHRVAFADAHEWILRLGKAKRQGRLDEELGRLGRIPLVICDEFGYIPFDPEAASLFFALLSSRYERSSLIASSNKTFSTWTEIFGDAMAVAAMVDRLVHPRGGHRSQTRQLPAQGQRKGGDGFRRCHLEPEVDRLL
jgi:DNA replication protein DnaC